MVALPSYNQEAQPSQFEQLPAGTYTMKIVEAEVEDISKSEDKGGCLKLTWQVSGGQHDGQMTWQRLSLWAENFKSQKPGKSDEEVTQQARDIANQQFAAVREATVGVGKVVTDTDVLLHIPCLVTVGPQKKNPQYNEIKAVKPMNSGAASGTAGKAPAAANGGGSLPWKKSA
ncbi:DUF669 domain-containing protein [Tianweitania sediminis]|uniref:DUF669 domain-containing protein n=1 Tax=Tianweitania sediminis TaxID=1502156 RepID=A0A8J7R1T4_9HYPH|nr:DUF669 domain-containing protein [Tianweitania sediminis]MBP0440660.1 DUF669 domain-containing protein [Tianweitania sediminis]